MTWRRGRVSQVFLFNAERERGREGHSGVLVKAGRERGRVGHSGVLVKAGRERGRMGQVS